MFKKTILAAVIGFLTANSFAAAPAAPRERIAFNDSWRFIKGDPANVGPNLAYTNLLPWLLPMQNEFKSGAPVARPPGNPGGDVAYVQPGFNDSAWRKLNLPHDFGIEGPFSWDLPGRTGRLPWAGVAWYRKTFTVPAADAGRQLALEVDGAMSYASVWINGQFVGGWPYGYSSWTVDLTPHIKFGGENTIAIRLDNPPESSRWYPGGGIYRNVWLTKTSPVRVAHWGVSVTTPQVSKEAATVHVRVQINNDSAAPATVTVINQFNELKPDNSVGNPLGAVEEGGHVIAAGQATVRVFDFKFGAPKLWSVEKPNRYVVTTIIKKNGKVVDSYETPFGIRTIKFTADDGFHLNGQRVPLKGVCNHHDLGALGAAINTRALERQLEIMKEMGVNAIRTSHNPPAPELLDLCDRMGLLVMDEAFDCWATGKNPNDYGRLYADWHEADLRALVRRDRNHPSLILWSSGNEVLDQDKPAGPELAENHRRIIHEEDPTRPATVGVNSVKAGFSGFQNHMDVFGWNYKPERYASFRATNSAIPLYASETASTESTRGEYFFPVIRGSEPNSVKLVRQDKNSLKDFQISSYDYYVPSWATTPDVEWVGQAWNPGVAGEFVWTGFDYLGEPTPFNADVTTLLNFHDPAAIEKARKELEELGKIRPPSRSSYFGIVDLAGFKKDRFYLYQSHWRPEFPMAHILPHWNWPERVGQVTPVFVYTSGDSAELFLNGKSLGKKSKGTNEFRLRWEDVAYQPGELKAVAYKNGKKWATDVVKTAGPATKLLLAADRAKIAGDRNDLSFVTVTVADQAGRLVPRSKNQLKFALTGPGEIVAVDNGDATSFESFQAPERKAFNGLALVVVRATAPGKIVLTATAAGLSAGEVTITAR